MRLVLLVHIAAGGLALIAGYVALWSAKGAPLHRRVGTAFVYSMLTMAATGMAVSAVRNVAPEINIPAGALAAYLVITALTTLRPTFSPTGWLHRVGMLVALSVAIPNVVFAYEAVTSGGQRNGMPAFPFFMFGLVAMIAVAGDIRIIRAGPPRGAARVARHLWRMSFALFIAALSFFIGQSDELPRAIRILPLLALPVLAVLVTMLYWLWRVRVRRSMRGLIRVGVPEAA